MSRQALPKKVVFDVLQYAPKTEQVCEFHNSPARIRIISAPARTSKSYSAAYDAIYHVIPEFEEHDGQWFPMNPANAQDRRVWIVGPDYRTIKEFDYVWREVVQRSQLRSLVPYTVKNKTNSPQHGNMRIVLDFGVDVHGDRVTTIIEGKSATNPESLQGEQIWCAVLSEAAELPEFVLTRYLSTRCRYIIEPTTPKLKADWIRRQMDEATSDPSLSIESFHFTGASNPHYDWELFEIEKKKAASRTASGFAEDDAWFAEQFLGMWTGAEDRLLPFRADAWGGRKSHVTSEIPHWFDPRQTFVSMDYGYSDACVALFWATGPLDRLLILSEIYDRNLTLTEFADAARRRANELGIVPFYWTGDPRQPQLSRILRDKGLPVLDIDRNAQSDRAAGGHALVDALSDDPNTGEPRLMILSEKAGTGYGCPTLVREWKLLRRNANASKEWSEAAVVGDDHAFDAARYGIMTRPRFHSRVEDRSIKSWIKMRERLARMRPMMPNRMMVGASPSLVMQ